MPVIAEREYEFVFDDARPSEKVLLRVGAPEEKDPAKWVLPFEIIGPGQRRMERAFPAVDAVQSLQWGLQMIALELRSLQSSAGGKLHFLDEESLGFDPLNLP
ncbi:DUF6968 family protein [Polyangium mundeleinium]|uniref:DUF6968 domain-containing protein n=1 Tax=Polyangium mundeleinium TaxID=2995306 RepID=A0ABT5EF17_9BACT|nr:hypothetical protein [Polyangium mundeleinium]MDC0739848.1 hypothetical protein [Polyangium mundeleinium]